VRRTSIDAEESTDPEAAREAALRLLDHAQRTRRELSRRLRERGFEAATVEAVLDRLAAVSLVDDVEYARAWLAGRWGRRAAGWRRLEMELSQKGVSREDITRARVILEQSVGASNEVETARRVISQAARRYAGLDPRTRRQRLYAMLARRGFDADVIRQALELREPAES
jgi:regulatory protein